MIAGASLLAASLAVTACGSRAESGSGGGSGGGGTKTAKIGVVAPLSGDLSPLGIGIRNSVDLAIKEANANNTIPGWKLELVAEDDEGKPDTGKNAATKLTSDDEVVGAVGPLNSSVGQAVQPIFQSANVTLISPANTNPTLTKGADLANPKRTYDNYFRTCTTDAIQGPFAAKYLLDSGIKEVATIHDKKAYGQGLVSAFSEAFTAGGGKVTTAETINPDDKDFSAVISKVKASNPKAVYYGGEYPQAGPLSQQMKGAGLNVPLMGGDGIYDPKYIQLAGPNSNGDLATSVGAPTEKLESAKKFVDAYKAGGYSDPYGAYGAYSYDAANAIIQGLKTSLASAQDAKSARKDTIAAVGKVDFQGATGKVAFDQWGDSTARVLTVYKVSGGEWTADKTEDFK
ncbi:branched chain amino acid ABC transporter substrate-binding protein [Enemella evansiae]|uniref:Branched chain amino acid ABC transporter substrate-binding protein n=2 Tax=Enemella evansiae TaxID=2016499 RepID=A0A255GGA8_9ACTN|nr:branched-chain amino acid ABC transporter substrate-binding protein [Enemella evansiae]OYN93151.1 branched chain amino acid ABC transporter substrate-binding protein [Enemella evansiae]OYN95958.1 branched chain amino acid ABC transporter substrate-binding protein [Enemella evansiae]OYO04362.1 branched chain amino acid ABC transporter substrate-binding protein [Enemella evansiae]OYO08609.1 branched chain amino acid ABC transporter substrate-binding protein [Enemella evansiae]OYO13230.1 branc